MESPKINVLVTGGAGFIGSNLVAALLDDPRIGIVRVLDNLSNGYLENIKPFESNPNFQFLEGDICDYATCINAMEGIDKVSHQAALGSVPRSIKDPMLTDKVNVGGTVNVLHAAVEQKIDRVILAFSSSTYGDHPGLPKVEDKIGNPLSPYAVSKATDEMYASVFQRTYGLNYIGLRYFNVFGPNQRHDNPYAAVIPLFCQAFLEDRPPVIFGDGLTSRDFTYVDNAVQANMKALFTDNKKALNEVYNVACGERTTLLDIVKYLQEITGKKLDPIHQDERTGDVKHSLADISKIKSLLGYQPTVYMKEGLKKVYDWYRNSDLPTLRPSDTYQK
ncbi:MAG: SDR family oxidoreductase [Cyclobacteriaceae bacterium]